MQQCSALLIKAWLFSYKCLNFALLFLSCPLCCDLTGRPYDDGFTGIPRIQSNGSNLALTEKLGSWMYAKTVFTLIRTVLIDPKQFSTANDSNMEEVLETKILLPEDVEFSFVRMMVYPSVKPCNPIRFCEINSISYLPLSNCEESCNGLDFGEKMFTPLNFHFGHPFEEVEKWKSKLIEILPIGKGGFAHYRCKRIVYSLMLEMKWMVKQKSLILEHLRSSTPDDGTIAAVMAQSDLIHKRQTEIFSISTTKRFWRHLHRSSFDSACSTLQNESQLNCMKASWVPQLLKASDIVFQTYLREYSMCKDVFSRSNVVLSSKTENFGQYSMFDQTDGFDQSSFISHCFYNTWVRNMVKCVLQSQEGESIDEKSIARQRKVRSKIIAGQIETLKSIPNKNVTCSAEDKLILLSVVACSGLTRRNSKIWLESVELVRRLHTQSFSKKTLQSIDYAVLVYSLSITIHAMIIGRYLIIESHEYLELGSEGYQEKSLEHLLEAMRGLRICSHVGPYLLAAIFFKTIELCAFLIDSNEEVPFSTMLIKHMFCLLELFQDLVSARGFEKETCLDHYQIAQLLRKCVESTFNKPGHSFICATAMKFDVMCKSEAAAEEGEKRLKADKMAISVALKQQRFFEIREQLSRIIPEEISTSEIVESQEAPNPGHEAIGESWGCKKDSNNKHIVTSILESNRHAFLLEKRKWVNSIREKFPSKCSHAVNDANILSPNTSSPKTKQSIPPSHSPETKHISHADNQSEFPRIHESTLEVRAEKEHVVNNPSRTEPPLKLPPIVSSKKTDDIDDIEKMCSHTHLFCRRIIMQDFEGRLS